MCARKFVKKTSPLRTKITIFLFVFVYATIGFSQCPSAGSTLFSSQTISSNCTVSGDLTLQGAITLTIDPGVTLTVDGRLTIQGNATISASSTSNINIGGDFRDNWTGGGTNTISGGVYSISGDLVEASGGNFVIENATVNADSAYTSGGAYLQVLNNSEVIIARGMYNSEDLLIDAAYMEIGGDLDATGGDNITVRNGGELLVKGDYKMNNGGGVQMNIEDGGVVKIQGDVESSGGGNTIDVDDDSGIAVDGDFTGDDPPDVSVGTDDEDSDCLSGGGCCGDASACGEATTLPVSLIDFTQSNSDNLISLKWRTATELNNDFFTIERSLDGNNFVEVANIAGRGTTNDLSEYSFSDKLFYEGLVYYRLSQTDFDGTYEILGTVIVSLRNELQSSVIYPNPVTCGNEITVTNTSDDVKWNIYSMNGNIVKSGIIYNQKALIEGLKSGTYLFGLNSPGAKKQILVVK